VLENEQQTSDVAILAGRVPFRNGLYVVGPFAERVSFAAQQRRALSLVWGIDQDLRRAGQPRGLWRKKVGVVGAGLAGLTCSLALAAFESSVWIFDEQLRALNRMMKADHRDIHPTINFWPREELEVTTFLPFLNWFQDSCDGVLKRVWDEWETLQSQTNLIKRIESGCTVHRIGAQGDHWNIEATTTDGRTLPKTSFDILILATGFGTERIVLGADSAGYWEAERDPIGPLVKAESSPCHHHVISGTGDGGLIEVLRLLYGKFRAGSIERWTVPMISDAGLAEAISPIESEVRHRVSDAILHGALGLDDTAKDEISEFLWDRYTSVLNEGMISESVEQEMCAAQTHVHKVVLLGERPSPLEHTASPYHRLLLTFCIYMGLVEYHRVEGKVAVADCLETGGRAALAQRLGIVRKDLTFKSIGQIGRSFARTAEPETVQLPCSLFICRHGYKSPLSELLDEANSPDVSYVRTRQQLYGDQDALTLEQIHSYAKELGLSTPQDRAAWADRHEEMAVDYFRRRHGLHARAWAPARARDKTVYKLRAPRREEDARTRDSSKLIPRTFMGVPVEAARALPVQGKWQGHG